MAERRARRRIPGRDRQQDTGAGLLLGQIVICAAAVAVALGLSTANPMQAAAVSPKIQLLMTAEKVTLPEQAVIAAKEQGGMLWNRSWMDRTTAARQPASRCCTGDSWRGAEWRGRLDGD